MPGAFEIGPVLKQIKEIFFTVIRIPFEFWYNVNSYIKIGIILFIFALSIFTILFVLKNKDRWKHKVY